MPDCCLNATAIISAAAISILSIAGVNPDSASFDAEYPAAIYPAALSAAVPSVFADSAELSAAVPSVVADYAELSAAVPSNFAVSAGLDAAVPGITEGLVTSGSATMSTSEVFPGTSDTIAAKASPFDVVINEIMARPAPSAQLPEAEYIELYNRSPYPVNLQNWTITVGSTSRVITGDRIMEPGDYLLISHEKYKPLLRQFGQVAGIASFPVLAMGGQTIVLRDQEANVISAVRYSDKWYGNSLKESGGWSLEQIDPFNPCGGGTNWRASNDPRGGTPGRTNSIRSDNPDYRSPAAVRATTLSQSSIRLHFSESMHPEADWLPGQFFAEGPGHPLYSIPVKPFYDAVDLHFGSLFEENTIYLLNIDGGRLYDCAGNKITAGNTEIRFALPGTPERNDIIINEILFNPLPGGAGFVELVNTTAHRTFDLKSLVLSGIREGQPDRSYIIAPEGYLFFPGEYLVLTTDPETVMDHYYSPCRNSFVTMDRLPPMHNEQGTIAISGLQMDLLEEMSYTSDMHSPLLVNRKGVSLERLSLSRPASDASNWHSASETAGFATPGYKNSQAPGTIPAESVSLTVEPKVFSHGSSDHESIEINYNLENPGYAATINVFDSRGRLVKRLVRNELLGFSGKYYWNGRNEANSIPRQGIYIIMMELFHPDGEVRKFKEPVVLTW